MNTEKRTEQKKNTQNPEEYLKEALAVKGVIWKIFNDFNKDNVTKERGLKVKREELTTEEPIKAIVKGRAYKEETRRYLNDEDLRIFNQLAQDIRKVPNIKVKYIPTDRTEEEDIIGLPNQVIYTITPDLEAFESSD
jgi:hypothetical protein